MTVARQERKQKAHGKKEGTENVLAGNPESGPLSTHSEQAFCEPGTGVGRRGETSDAAKGKETGNKETGKAGDKARKGEEEKREDEEGIERLQRAAGDVVRLNCGELSQVLLGKAKEGHMGGFKLLMMLAERKKAAREAGEEGAASNAGDAVGRGGAMAAGDAGGLRGR
jgi:hypothetical protein